MRCSSYTAIQRGIEHLPLIADPNAAIVWEPMQWRKEMHIFPGNVRENTPVSCSIWTRLIPPRKLPLAGIAEPGGWPWHQTLSHEYEKSASLQMLLAQISSELCLLQDSIRSDFLEARLIFKTIAYRFSSPKSI